MIVMLLLFLSGLFVLFFGAELLIGNGKKLAATFGIPPIIIGITLVAFGTSLPEMVVSLLANLKGEGGIALGNIIGSNIANIGLVLGFSAIVAPISFQFKNNRSDFFFLVGISFLLAIICFSGDILRIYGLVFVLLLTGYLRSLFLRRKMDNSNNNSQENMVRIVLFTSVGIVLLYIGTELFIRGSIGIAKQMGVTNTNIGLTLVALGTSAPELAASLSAARKGESDMIIGNIIGSNLFNILAVIGVTSLFNTIVVNIEELQISIIIFLGLVCLLPILLAVFNKIHRISGIFLSIIYLLFLFMVYY